MGSAASLKYIPGELTEADCRAIAGTHYKKGVFKRLSVGGVVTKEALTRFFSRADVYFAYFWIGSVPPPSLERKVRLLRNMAISYGLTVITRSDPPAPPPTPPPAMDNGLSVVVFLTADVFTQPVLEIADDEELRQLHEPSVSARAILLVLEENMRDRDHWGPAAQSLFPPSVPVVDASGDLNESLYLSQVSQELKAAVLAKVGAPIMTHPIRKISVVAPFVPSSLSSKRGGLAAAANGEARVDRHRRASVNVPVDQATLCASLLQMYHTLHGDDWTAKDNWCSNESADVWLGLTCDQEKGLLFKTSLPRNNLVGALPLSIFAFENLRRLDLSHNTITGELPSEISRLRQLRFLVLHHNNLSGEIPMALGELTNLLELRLQSNGLTGPLPLSLSALTELALMDASDNQLSGVLPACMGHMQALRSLYLSHNQLDGGIPSELGEAAELMLVDLSHNRLSGPVPPSLGRLRKLEHLSLQGNSLSEAIPSELSSLQELSLLDLSSNQLAGGLPRDFSALARLTCLNLGDNKLAGMIPTSYSALKRLEELSLHNNAIAGEIPRELALLPSLRVLRLGLNRLIGKIPTEVSKLARLQVLCLNNNKLTGGIPRDVSALSDLRELRLSDNQLECTLSPYSTGLLSRFMCLACTIRGAIPQELGCLSKLEVLCLQSNLFFGAVPYDLSKLTNLRELHIGSNSLTSSRAELEFILPNCPTITL